MLKDLHWESPSMLCVQYPNLMELKPPCGLASSSPWSYNGHQSPSPGTLPNQFLKQLISNITKIIASWVLAQYQIVPNTETKGYYDTSPLKTKTKNKRKKPGGNLAT